MNQQCTHIHIRDCCHCTGNVDDNQRHTACSVSTQYFSTVKEQIYLAQMPRTTAPTISIHSTRWKKDRWTGGDVMEKVFDKVTDCHFKTTRHLNSCSFTKKSVIMWTTTVHCVIVISPSISQNWLIGSHARAVHLIPTCLIHSNISITTAVWISSHSYTSPDTRAHVNSGGENQRTQPILLHIHRIMYVDSQEFLANSIPFITTVTVV